MKTTYSWWKDEMDLDRKLAPHNQLLWDPWPSMQTIWVLDGRRRKGRVSHSSGGICEWAEGFEFWSEQVK